MSDSESLFSSKEPSEAHEIYFNSLGVHYGNQKLGENTTRILREDPRRLLFTLSKYKFVAKMFCDSQSILEVGCQEGFGAHLVIQEVKEYVGIDFYHPYIDFANSSLQPAGAEFRAHDLLDGPVLKLNGGRFESAFALDVLEHILPKDEENFLLNFVASLDHTKGQAIFGMPSLESQVYASTASKLGHVNCKTARQLKITLEHFFEFVYIFSFNDEVLHTGFHPMSQYVIALCSKPREHAISHT